MHGKEAGVRMCTMPEFLGLTQIFQSQQVFPLTSMISAYKYKAGSAVQVVLYAVLCVFIYTDVYFFIYIYVET